MGYMSDTGYFVQAYEYHLRFTKCEITTAYGHCINHSLCLQQACFGWSPASETDERTVGWWLYPSNEIHQHGWDIHIISYIHIWYVYVTLYKTKKTTTLQTVLFLVLFYSCTILSHHFKHHLTTISHLRFLRRAADVSGSARDPLPGGTCSRSRTLIIKSYTCYVHKQHKHVNMLTYDISSRFMTNHHSIFFAIGCCFLWVSIVFSAVLPLTTACHL